MRLAIRGYLRGERIFEDRLSVSSRVIEHLVPELVAAHASLMKAGRLGMVEIEFLDEADHNARYYRFGVDPSGSGYRIAVR